MIKTQISRERVQEDGDSCSKMLAFIPRRWSRHCSAQLTDVARRSGKRREWLRCRRSLVAFYGPAVCRPCEVRGGRYCTEKAPNTWHRQGTQNTGNTYQVVQSTQTTANRHNSQTKHQAPSQAEVGVPVMVTKECTCKCSDSILGRTNTNI